MCEDTKSYNGHTYSGVLLEACINGYEQGRADERTVIKNCYGCKHIDKWENEIEYGCPSPCTTCSRRCVDNYEVDKTIK